MMPDGRLTPVRSEHVRRANLALVLDALRRRGPLSRSNLVAATGLTRSAISTLVEELVGLGLAREDAASSGGSPGRPSPVVRVDIDHHAVLAIDIGVDELGVAAVALDGTVIRSVRLIRQRQRVPVATTIDEIVELVDRLAVVDAVVAGRSVVGVGVAVPGAVRAADNRVASAPNLGWRDVGLGGLLDVALGDRVRQAGAGSAGRRLEITVGNESDLGALAEATFGAGVGAEHLVYIHGEVGVGGGVIVHGRPLAGRSGYAGEIGHFPVNPDGLTCECGSIGCWETEVGEPALLRRGGLDPDGGLDEVRQLLTMYEAGDDTARRAFDEHGRWLAIGITGLVNVFDPDVVVVGGLLHRVLEASRPSLDAELRRRRFRAVERQVPVIAAELGADVTFIGAAELAFGAIAGDPAAIA